MLGSSPIILGAVNALQDAVILANCIHDLESTSPSSISACFQDFKEQRYAHVKNQYETSQFTAKIMYGHVSQNPHSGDFECCMSL
jgi:hypothetical protein